MIRLLYSPQFSARRIEYQLEGEVLTATLDTGETDTFDFSALPDGRAEEVSTSLPIQPIVSAERVAGVLQLELLKFMGLDADHDTRFPTWQEVTDGAY
jgi:hypothetical protein